MLCMLFTKVFYKALFSNVWGVDWIIRITEETKECFCVLANLCWHQPSCISDSDATLSCFQFLFKQLTGRASLSRIKAWKPFGSTLLALHVVVRCRYWQDWDVHDILCDCFCRASSSFLGYARKSWAHPGQNDSSYKPRFVKCFCDKWCQRHLRGWSWINFESYASRKPPCN